MDKREIVEELGRIVGTAEDEYLGRTRTVAGLENLAARLVEDIGAAGPARPYPSDSPLAPRTVAINEGELQALRKDVVDARAWREMCLGAQAERDALRAEVDTLKAELSYATGEAEELKADWPADHAAFKQQADAWKAVCLTLDELTPGWCGRGHNDQSGCERAVQAIRDMGAELHSMIARLDSLRRGYVKRGWRWDEDPEVADVQIPDGDSFVAISRKQLLEILGLLGRHAGERESPLAVLNRLVAERDESPCEDMENLREQADAWRKVWYFLCSEIAPGTYDGSQDGSDHAIRVIRRLVAERDRAPVILEESRDYTRDQLEEMAAVAIDGRDDADRLDSLEAAMGDVQARLRLLGATGHTIRGHLVDQFNRIRDVEAGIRLLTAERDDLADVGARLDILTTEYNTFRDQIRRAFRRLARHGGLHRWPRPR